MEIGESLNPNIPCETIEEVEEVCAAVLPCCCLDVC